MTDITLETGKIKKEEEEQERHSMVEKLATLQDEELVGFRFHPTDIELIGHYLRRRMDGSSNFSKDLIPECDIYQYEPWKLPRDSVRLRNEEKEMYFFTPRHPSNGSAQRASRIAGRGYWKGYGKDKLIKIGSKVIGHKTALTYKLFDGMKEIKTNWIMHEYRLQSTNSSEEKTFDDLVLCKIHEKKKWGDELDGVGPIVEESPKRRKADEPEQQQLITSNDSNGSHKINSASNSTQQKDVHGFKISDLLSDIIREGKSVDAASAGGGGASSWERKARYGGIDYDENSSTNFTETRICNSSICSTSKSMLDVDDNKSYDPLQLSDEGLSSREEKETIGVSPDIDLSLSLGINGNIKCE